MRREFCLIDNLLVCGARGGNAAAVAAAAVASAAVAAAAGATVAASSVTAAAGTGFDFWCALSYECVRACGDVLHRAGACRWGKKKWTGDAVSVSNRQPLDPEEGPPLRCC